MTNRNPDDYVLITEENSKLIPARTSIYVTDCYGRSAYDTINLIDYQRNFILYSNSEYYPVRCDGGAYYRTGYVHKNDLISSITNVDNQDHFLIF